MSHATINEEENTSKVFLRLSKYSNALYYYDIIGILYAMETARTSWSKWAAIANVRVPSLPVIETVGSGQVI